MKFLPMSAKIIIFVLGLDKIIADRDGIYIR